MAATVKRANEIFKKPEDVRWPGQLFDDFWREGELAILFGPQGVGKSLLATQVAEMLARGRQMDGFAMPGYRRRVLYVDMRMSDAQFRRRYSYRPGENREMRLYRFSDNFFHGRTDDTDGFVQWLRGEIEEKKFEVVVVDDAAAFRQTLSGTRELVRLMRGLKKLKDDTGVSILVLACSGPPQPKMVVAEKDLGLMSRLCDLADSVFALGSHPNSPGHRYLIQTRVRTGMLKWNEYTAPTGRIIEIEKGFPALMFDERFAPTLDEATRELVKRIGELRAGGATFRAIADQLGISLSRASRLWKKWGGMMEMPNDEYRMTNGNTTKVAAAESATPERAKAADIEADPDDKLEEYELCGHERPPWMEHEKTMNAECQERIDGEVPTERSEASAATGGNATVRERASAATHESASAAVPADVLRPSWPQSAAGRRRTSQRDAGVTQTRRTIYDLEVELDAYGREIYIEDRNETTKQPMVWYQRNRQGILYKNVRKMWAIFGEKLGETIYIE